MSDFLLQLSWREPLWLLLILAPLMLTGLARQRRRKLASYADPHLLPWALAAQGSGNGFSMRVVLIWVAWSLLAIAAAGPRTPLEQPADALRKVENRHHLTLMVALDISTSMAATDIAPDRLTRARLELADLFKRLRGERVGLLVFAGEAGILLPPSDDVPLLTAALEKIEPALIERQGTNLAAALSLAREQFKAESHKALLLVTDGDADSFAGQAGEAARQAAEKLAQAGIPLFVLGVGSESGAAIPLSDGGYAEKESAQVVSRLGTASLSELARLGGGAFAPARDADNEWVQLYERGIATLPGGAVKAEQAKAWRERYAVPLTLSLLLFMAGYLPKKPIASLAASVLLIVALPYQDASAGTLEAGWKAYQAKNYPQARALYLRAGDYAGYMGAGAAAWQFRDYAGASRYYSNALMLARTPKERTDALYNLGNAHFARGNWLAATEAYRTVLLQRPNDSRAQTNLAQAERQLEKQRQQQRDPAKSDLRGRRGMLVQGEVNLDWDRETVVKEFEPEPAGAQVDKAQKDAAGARLSAEQQRAAKLELDARRLQSGLRKLPLIEDRPRAMLQGMMKQDRQSSAEMELAPW